MPVDFSEKRRKLLEERARQRGVEETPAPPTAAEDVPEVYDRSPYDEELDSVVKKLSILDAYRLWIGKTVDEATLGRREGVKVSCPKPDHPDRNPSAWLNLDNNLWFCGGCQEGGDIYDLASFSHNIPNYKDGTNFGKLRDLIASDLGYTTSRLAGNVRVLIAPDDSENSVPDNTASGTEGTSPTEPANRTNPTVAGDTAGQTGQIGQELLEPTSEPQLATVARIGPEDEIEDNPFFPSIAWREIVPKDTFLYNYMIECTCDDSPEEYHFWHGLLAVGHALGRKTTLDDTRPVYGNLLLCLLGSTGVGKSRSRAHLDTVLTKALPFRDTGLGTEGVKIVTTPSSGEFLVRSFQCPMQDPADPKKTLGNAPVNGIVDFDEMAALLSRANRQGNTLKPLMMQLADAKDQISTGSLTHGSFIAEQPFCSITASTQPSAVRALLAKSDVGSGFLNRWVFAAGPPKRREVIGGRNSGITVNLDKACDDLRAIRAWSSTTSKIYWSDEAVTLMERFFFTKIKRALDSSDDLLKRLDLLAKKIVLLLTANERLDEVPAYIVERTETLFDYWVECYGVLSSNIGITQNQEIVEELERHILRISKNTGGRGVTVREIMQRIKRKNYSPEHIKRALDTMVALERIEPIKSKGAGRPSLRYRVIGE